MDIPVSATPEEHIARLQTPQPAVKPEVIKTTATVLGVTMNFYEIRGLRGELSYQESTPEDSTVYLYSRSSDFSSYNPIENRYLGSIVMEGKELPSTTERIGYCAMANDNIVIGVARSERVKDYCQEQGGSFFRQFVLVSSGVLPNNFYLHGKVERRALGTLNGGLYLVETTDPETLWSFADALREYGFTDAIYITGGADRAFYRDADGAAQTMGDTTQFGKSYHAENIVPRLVFKVKKLRSLHFIHSNGVFVQRTSRFFVHLFRGSIFASSPQ